MKTRLDIRNGHNEKLVIDLNELMDTLDCEDVLNSILSTWCNDEDLKSIYNHIKEKFYEDKR